MVRVRARVRCVCDCGFGALLLEYYSGHAFEREGFCFEFFVQSIYLKVLGQGC